MNDLSSIPLADLAGEISRRLAAESQPFVSGRSKRCDPLPRTVECGKTVVAAVAGKYGYSEDEIMGRRRTARLARARQVAMAALWQAGFSLCEVGYFFGRCHGTVVQAIRRTGATRSTSAATHTPRRTAPRVRSHDPRPPATISRKTATPA